MTSPQAALAFQTEDDPSLIGVEVLAPIPAGFIFESGQACPDRHFRGRLYGPSDAPLVIVAGGISSGREVYAHNGRGWWSEIVAPGAAIDLTRWRVLAFDFAPLADVSLQVSTADQARLIEGALDHLEIDAAYGWVGSSYGGMVGLCFAARAPQRLGRLCAISAAHRPSSMAVAWRGIQRRILELAIDAGRPEDGLALARELAMTTYRGPEEFDERFSLGFDDEGRTDLCRYLMSRGQAYPKVIAPLRWASLSESLDRHYVRPEDVNVPTTLVGATTDRLVPRADLLELAERLPNLTALHEIDSTFGHDAFLKEVPRLTPILQSFLDG